MHLSSSEIQVDGDLGHLSGMPISLLTELVHVFGVHLSSLFPALRVWVCWSQSQQSDGRYLIAGPERKTDKPPITFTPTDNVEIPVYLMKMHVPHFVTRGMKTNHCKTVRLSARIWAPIYHINTTNIPLIPMASLIKCIRHTKHMEVWENNHFKILCNCHAWFRQKRHYFLSSLLHNNGKPAGKIHVSLPPCLGKIRQSYLQHHVCNFSMWD